MASWSLQKQVVPSNSSPTLPLKNRSAECFVQGQKLGESQNFSPLVPRTMLYFPRINQAGFLGRMPEVPFSQLRIHWNIGITTLETVVSPIHFRTWLETRKPKERSNRELFRFLMKEKKLGVGIWDLFKITWLLEVNLIFLHWFISPVSNHKNRQLRMPNSHFNELASCPKESYPLWI